MLIMKVGVGIGQHHSKKMVMVIFHQEDRLPKELIDSLMFFSKVKFLKKKKLTIYAETESV